ncbi:unnamed protein product, partial [Heterosigma akashiwo]
MKTPAKSSLKSAGRRGRRRWCAATRQSATPSCPPCTGRASAS